MKIALDPTPFHHTHSLVEFPKLARELGYDYLQITPHKDFIPFFSHPKADDELVAKLAQECKKYGVEIASVLPVLKWSSPDPLIREASVRYWKRAIQMTVDLGVHQMNTEFSGRPELPEESEAAFYRSMEEIVPLIEREGVHVAIDPHPDDFVEEGLAGWRMIRGVNSPNLGFAYVAAHTFHMKDEPLEIMQAAGERLRVVHVADTMNHRASHGARYITNPPGNAVRVHQHLRIGEGDVDWDEFFGGLAANGFFDREDSVMATCVFAENERAHEVARYQLKTMNEYIDKASTVRT